MKTWQVFTGLHGGSCYIQVVVMLLQMLQPINTTESICSARLELRVFMAATLTHTGQKQQLLERHICQDCSVCVAQEHD